MNLTKIIADLRSELQRFDDAILALTDLLQNQAKRRARPTPQSNYISTKSPRRPPGSKNKPKLVEMPRSSPGVNELKDRLKRQDHSEHPGEGP